MIERVITKGTFVVEERVHDFQKIMNSILGKDM